jgi:hypothetical protein
MFQRKDDLLTIVVPTRDRHDTLSKVIEHLLDLNLQRVRVLISDNLSHPPVSDVLANLPESFKVIRTKSRLSMPSHWRFALSYVSTPYLTVIGDDDIIWGNRLLAVLPLLESRIASVFFWPRFSYYWLNYRDSNLAGMLSVSKDFVASRVDLNELYHRIFALSRNYAVLPSVYNSLVSTETAISLFGSTEELVPVDCIAPDMASAFRICSHFKDGIFLTAQVSVSGISHHSNGMNPSQHALFFSEFTEINLRPRWLNRCCIPSLGSAAKDLFFLIHDYFSGSSRDLNFGEDFEDLPDFFRSEIFSFYANNEIAIVNSAIEMINKCSQSLRTVSPVRQDALTTSFFPSFSMTGGKIPQDFEGNELLLVSRFLGTL